MILALCVTSVIARLLWIGAKVWECTEEEADYLAYCYVMVCLLTVIKWTM